MTLPLTAESNEDLVLDKDLNLGKHKSVCTKALKVSNFNPAAVTIDFKRH